MPKNRIILALGALIAILPVLGFPHKWEAFFQVLAGLSIVGLSVWSTIDKKLSMKAKAQRRQAEKRQMPMVEEAPLPESEIEKEWSEVSEIDKPGESF